MVSFTAASDEDASPGAMFAESTYARVPATVSTRTPTRQVAVEAMPVIALEVPVRLRAARAFSIPGLSLS